METTFLDQDGKAHYFIMGCYGIGISRIAAAVVEQSHDEKGIIWPLAIAPYHVHLLSLNPKKPAIQEASERIYRALTEAGIEVLFDDRLEIQAGAKFADADLLGLPYRITVGRLVEQGKVEIVHRATGTSTEIKIEETVPQMLEYLVGIARPQLSFVEEPLP
jgi:prolyl-tRNA synthetase